MEVLLKKVRPLKLCRTSASESPSLLMACCAGRRITCRRLFIVIRPDQIYNEFNPIE